MDLVYTNICDYIFLFALSNGMEVDGFHIRVDLTGQNKKVEKQNC